MQAVNAYGADHIILPPEMHFLEDDAGNFTAYKVATAHGAGRIEFGTYAFSLDDIPETVEAPAGPLPRGDPLSTLRPVATDLTRFYAIFPQPALARDLFNIVEGHRVDSAIRRAYPGIRRDMALIQSASAERRPSHGHPLGRPGRGRVAAAAHPRPAAGPLRAAAGDRGPDRPGGRACSTRIERPRARASATPPRSPASSTS